MSPERDSAKSGSRLIAADLAAMIDVSAVQAFNTEQDVRELAESAARAGFIMAHALPHYVPLLRSLLPRGGRTMVGAPIGFPSGGHATATKLAEAKDLILAGAEELDLMMNIGRLKSGDLAYVQDEVSAVVKAAAPIPVKVIIEVGYLTDDEILKRLRHCCQERSGFRQDRLGVGFDSDDRRPSRPNRRHRSGRRQNQSVGGHP